jgi:hypothetical protein
MKRSKSNTSPRGAKRKAQTMAPPKAYGPHGNGARPAGQSVWRLADRGPICAYDEYFDDYVELELGQDDPTNIKGLLIDFRYTDRDGEISRRSLLCWQCGRDGDRIYVRGYSARIFAPSALIACQT